MLLYSKLMEILVNKINRIFFDRIRIQFGKILIKEIQADESKKELNEYEVKIFSQWGEDGILDYLVGKIQLKYPSILEIGVGNFEECNSRFLMENRLARVVVVDKNKALNKFLNNYPEKWKFHIDNIQEYVTKDNISRIFRKSKEFLNKVDILSIDIDGMDYWILKEIPLEEISIIICEYNPIFGHQNALTVPYSASFDRTAASLSGKYFGASIRTFVEYLENQNFVFLGSNKACVNAFFVRKDFLDKIDVLIPDHSDLSSSTKYITQDIPKLKEIYRNKELWLDLKGKELNFINENKSKKLGEIFEIQSIIDNEMQKLDFS